jgi:hypothetical protein
LRDAIQRERTKIGKTAGSFTLTMHFIILSKMQCLVKNQIPAVSCPQYFQTALKGNHFASAEEIQLTATPSLSATSNRASEGAYSNGRTAVASLYVEKGSTSRLTRLGFIYLFLQTVQNFFWEVSNTLHVSSTC